MALPASAQLQQAETEIAILQVQFKNIDDKVDDLKADLKEIRKGMDDNNDSTHVLLKEFQSANVLAHKDMSNKITALEKWRWMLMGAGLLLGALGSTALGKLVGM